MPFVPSRDGLCLSFIGHVNVCPFSLSRSPRCSRFVFLVFSSLSYFLALIVWGTRGFLLFPQTASCYGVLTRMISVDHWAVDPESVARWPRSVCPRGPVVPWSRLAPWLGLSLA